MDERELKALIADQIQSAVGYDSDQISAEREENLNFYRGEPYGNERSGFSQVVTREVSDVVELIMPQLMDMFAGADKAVEFAPRRPNDAALAELATQYVDYVLNHDNDGYVVMQTAMKDGLISKRGVAKVYWEERLRPETERYRGLSDDELTLLLGEPDVEIAEQETQQSLQQVRAPDGQVFEQAVPSHDVTISRMQRQGLARVVCVPPEDFFVNQRSAGLWDADFVAYRIFKSKSDLIAEGFDRDMVEELPAEPDRIADEERDARYVSEDDLDESRDDVAMQKVKLFECYTYVDVDDDGVAELRRVVVTGDDANEILENEPVDDMPFVAWSPILMPHDATGMGVVDLVKDVQLIQSTLMRQMLDGLYLSTNPRYAAVDGQVDLDDLINDQVGGIIRVTQPGMIEMLNLPWAGSQAFPMVQHWEEIKNLRSGVSPLAAGLDADALNNNAGAVANEQFIQAGQQRIKLIARNFAEMFLKPLVLKIYHLIRRYQDEQRIVRLNDQFIPIDPREWAAEMDVTVHAGLGTGDKTQALNGLNAIAVMQQQILAQGGLGGMVNPLHYFETLRRIVMKTGLSSDASPFFQRPDLQVLAQQAQAAARAQQQGSPLDAAKAAEIQSDIQIEQQKIALETQKTQAEQAENAAQIGEIQARTQESQARADEIRRRIVREDQKAVDEIALARERMDREEELKRLEIREKSSARVEPGGAVG